MNLLKVGMILPKHATDQFNSIYTLEASCKNMMQQRSVLPHGNFQIKMLLLFYCFLSSRNFHHVTEGLRLSCATSQKITKNPTTVILCHLPHTGKKKQKDKNPEDTHLVLYQILVCLQKSRPQKTEVVPQQCNYTHRA